MPTVRVKENEPFEVAMRRFKRTIEKTGLLTELRARELCSGDAWDSLEARVVRGELDPWSAADEMLRGVSA